MPWTEKTKAKAGPKAQDPAALAAAASAAAAHLARSSSMGAVEHSEDEKTPRHPYSGDGGSKFGTHAKIEAHLDSSSDKY